MFRTALLSLTLVAASFTVSAQDAKPAPAAAPAAAASTKVRLNTNMGQIVIELNAAKAPKTVENFLQYVKDYSPLAAGVRGLPFAAVMIVVSPRSADLAAKLGARRVVSSGISCSISVVFPLPAEDVILTSKVF